ncbi:hypothetical protein [Streptomyces sp. WMMB303]|uniref:hypothetical protein n=1 Tax=Streptomyces sp. WMMB303 TaxID=3034154 RepID=UPI0023EC2CCD|nr:hypothetical protein [Streptomyces sp. WMMB303]MDF4254549.1 hypothetical protein [Streptomyces sp. WMMB303]
MAKQSALVRGDSMAMKEAMDSLDSSLPPNREAVRGPYWKMAEQWNRALAGGDLFKVTERPGKDELDTAWRGVEAHDALLRSSPQWGPLWRQVQEIGEVTERWQRSTQAILQPAWKGHIEGNPGWERLWAHTEQKSSAARAALSAKLADLVEQKDPKNTETADAVAALREFSRTAAGYSQRTREELPLPTATETTLNPYPGYGPHRGAVWEAEDGQLIREEVRAGGERVVEAFKPWFWAEMVQIPLLEESKGGPEQPKTEHQALVSDALQAFTDQWENGPSTDLMEGLSEGKLWSGLLQRRPSHFVDWVDRAKEGAEWHGMMAGRAYELVELTRAANLEEPGSYSTDDIALLKNFGDTLHAHAERLGRTMPPGNNPDAEPYATPHEAGEAHRSLAGQLNAWRDSEMGQDLMNNPRRPRSEAVAELVDAVNAQLAFSVRETKADGEEVARGGAYDYDQWEASYRVLRVAKAAQGVLDEAADDVVWGNPPRNHSGKDKEQLRKVVATATSNAARLNRAPISRSVFTQTGQAAEKPGSQARRPSASAEPAAGRRERAPEVRQTQTANGQRPSRRQPPQQRGQQQQRQQSPQSRKPSQGQRPRHHRVPGYGPAKGAAHNAAQKQETMEEAGRASRHVDKLIDNWDFSGLSKRIQSANLPALSDLKALQEACKKRPSADTQEFRQAAERYGQIARRAHLLGEQLRRAHRDYPRAFSPQDIEDIRKLNAVADGSHDHAVRLARTRPPGNNPDARPYESPQMRRRGEKEMERRWAAFRGSVWGKWLLNGDPQEPAVKQLVSAWERRKHQPNDDWTLAGRMGNVARAADRLLKEYAETASRHPRIAEGMEKLSRIAEGAPKYAARLEQGELPTSVIPVNPRESREKRWGESRTEGRPAATSTPQAQQAARASGPATAARQAPTQPARPAAPMVAGPAAQAPRRAARV